MAEPTNDNDTEKVRLLRQRIEAHTELQVKLEGQRYLGASVGPFGNTWKENSTKSRGIKRPQRDKDDMLRTPLDIVSDKVMHIYGRFSVTDFAGNFVTLADERVGTESPEYAEKLDLLQDLYWRWLPQSRIREWADNLNFRRVVFGWEMGRWRLPWTQAQVEKYGALMLDPNVGARIVTHSTVTSQDPNDHRYLISIEAMPLDEINDLWEPGLKAKGRFPLKGGRKMGQLVTCDQYLSQYIGRKVYGATTSETPGATVCTMWDDYFETMDVFLFVPTYRDPKSGQETKKAWLHVWPVEGQSNDWPYGCPWLKLDLYPSVRKWVGDSLVMKVAPMEAVANLMMRAKLRRTLFSSLVRILVLSNALETGGADKLRSNKQFEIIGVKRGFPTEKIAQVLQFPRLDPGEESLLHYAFEGAQRLTASGEALAGEPSPRETATGFMSRVQQALVPLQPIAGQDQGRFTEWAKNGAEASARFHGLTSPRKRCMVIFGPDHKYLMSGSGSVGRVRKVLDSGPVKFAMHDEAFRPVPVEEIKEQLSLALKAGRFGQDLSDPRSWRRFAIHWYLRTGEEYEKGEADRFHEANLVVAKALRGEAVEIGYGDPVVWIKYLAKAYLGVSRGRKYTPEQRTSLRKVIAAAEDAYDAEVSVDSATAMRRQAASAGPNAGGPGGSTAGTAGAGTTEAGGGVVPEPLMAEAG